MPEVAVSRVGGRGKPRRYEHQVMAKPEFAGRVLAIAFGAQHWKLFQKKAEPRQRPCLFYFIRLADESSIDLYFMPYANETLPLRNPTIYKRHSPTGYNC